MHKAQAVQVRYREHNLGSVQPRQRFIEDALQQGLAQITASLWFRDPAYGKHLKELSEPWPEPLQCVNRLGVGWLQMLHRAHAVGFEQGSVTTANQSARSCAAGTHLSIQLEKKVATIDEIQ